MKPNFDRILRENNNSFVDDFDDLQSEFIMNAVKESQEQAVNKVLKKYSRKKR